MDGAAAAAVCGMWRYASIICVCLTCAQDVQPLSVVHVGGDEVNSEAFQSSSSCARSGLAPEELKHRFIGDIVRRAAELGVDVQAWDDALATSSERPLDVEHWTGGKNNVFINAWNSNRRSDAFSYADAGYKVCGGVVVSRQNARKRRSHC